MQGQQVLQTLARAACLSLSLMAAASGQEVVWGQIAPFTVTPSPNAAEINQGIKAYVAQANKANGIRGNKVNFFDLDDRYSAEGFAEQYGKALERKPVALLSPVGSAAISRLLADKTLDKSEMVIVNVVPGAESLRSPGHPRLFHLRAGDKQQIEKIVTHARTLGTSRMSVLYQDLEIGTSGWAVAEKAAKDAGGLDLKGVKSGTEPPALAAAAQQLKQQEPQSVLIVGAPRFMADGIAALRKAGLSQALFVLSYVQPSTIVKVAGPEGARGVGIAQTYPNPNGITLPVQRDFQAAMKVVYPQLTSYTSSHLEGYLSARTVGEAMKRSKEPVTTPAGLEKALHTAGEMDFGGFRVDFSKGNIGSKWVDIGVINADGKLLY